MDIIKSSLWGEKSLLTMTKLSRNIAKIFVLMCILVVGTPLFAQQTGKLTGTVTDALTGMPVSGANVKITAAADSSVVITDSAGIFRIGGWNGRLEIQASSIGYQTKRLNLEKVPDEELVIMLKPNATQLKEVAIRASKPLVRREIDRLIYQVQSDPENRSLNALEMMAKVPMLSLDAQDNIRLKGSGNYRVFVNGRPSALMAQNPAAALRAMPSSSVLRIEVITNPPAKYDAEGLAGIINVVLRQQTLNGYNGTIGMSFNDKVV